MSDSEDPLADSPFSYQTGKNEYVRILHHGRLALELRGQAASKFLQRVTSQDERSAQLAMAKITGQYKMGNERAGAKVRKNKGR
ncbi:MAG: hypothetical protein AAF529_17880 [Pseudomonadota bacterium]